MPGDEPRIDATEPKAEDALRTIGELAEELGIKPHILRYWEKQFAELAPLKRAGGRRHYRAEDVATVRAIDRLINERGFTVKGAKKALAATRSEAPSPAPTLEPAPSTRPAIDTAELTAIRDRLAAVMERI